MRVASLIAATAVVVIGCGGGSSSGLGRATIPARSNLRVAAESLSRAGLVRSPMLFRLYAKIRGGDRQVRAGTYELPKNLGYGAMLDALTAGKGLVRSVTIPEGFSVSQVVRAVSAKLQVPPESVEVATRDTALRRRLDIPAATVDGYLFPDTYTLPEGSTAREAIALMVRRFEQVWTPAWTARLDTIGLTRNDVMTLASIVEKEAKLPQERPVIASPGKPSIVAALYPAQVPYRYFVAFPDGHHEFRATMAQHEAIVKEARKAWAAWYRLHPADTATTRPK